MSRLTTEMMVDAALRQATATGVFASILRKGDVHAGAVYLEIEKDSSHAKLMARQLNFDGEYEWFCMTGDEWVAPMQVSEMLAKEVGRDPDCWIISVQDAKGRNIFELEQL